MKQRIILALLRTCTGEQVFDMVTQLNSRAVMEVQRAMELYNIPGLHAHTIPGDPGVPGP